MSKKYDLRQAERQRYAMRYIWPALIYLGCVLFIPLAFSVVASFFRWDLMPERIQFAWLDNYKKFFSSEETLNSVSITVQFMLITVSAEMILGFLIAMFLNAKFKGNRFVRVVVLLPMMLSPTVVALMWKMILNADRGILNRLLSLTLGKGAEQVWLGKDWAFFTIIAVDIWMNTSFVVLTALAGLQSISTEIIEAARIDGANCLQRTFHVVLPMMRQIILVALIFRTTFALRNFPLPWVLTAGGPANLTNVFGIELYKQAFQYYHIGYASAMSWLLILVTFGFSVLYTRATLKKESKA